MSKTRNNHYVPQWYQEGFLEPGQSSCAYLDLTPPLIGLPDGRTVPAKSRFKSAPAQCFSARDLYSTFFGSSVNDEIERRLFGAIDSKGAGAVRAFIATDVHGWIEQFETFFTYVDAQRLRTPKGLDWLKAQSFVNDDAIGITGFCWGGRIVWLYSGHSAKLRAGAAVVMVTGRPAVSPGKQPVVIAQVWLISSTPSPAAPIRGSRRSARTARGTRMRAVYLPMPPPVTTGTLVQPPSGVR